MIEITDITDIKTFHLKYKGFNNIVTYYRHEGWFNYKMFFGDEFIKESSHDTISEQSIIVRITMNVNKLKEPDNFNDFKKQAVNLK